MSSSNGVKDNGGSTLDENSSNMVDIQLDCDDEGLRKWLKEHEISQIFEGIIKSGIKKPDHLLELTKEDLNDLCSDLKLDLLTKRRFLTAVHRLHGVKSCGSQSTTNSIDEGQSQKHGNAQKINSFDVVAEDFQDLDNLFDFGEMKRTLRDFPHFILNFLRGAFVTLFLLCSTAGQAGVWYYEFRVSNFDCDNSLRLFFRTAAFVHVIGVVIFALTLRCCKKKKLWLYLYVTSTFVCGIISIIYMSFESDLWTCVDNQTTDDALLGLIVEVINLPLVFTTFLGLKLGYCDSYMNKKFIVNGFERQVSYSESD